MAVVFVLAIQAFKNFHTHLNQLTIVLTNGDTWRPAETPGDQARPLETKGDQQRPLETRRDHWRPRETNRDPWRPGETTGDQGRPAETPGDQARPRETSRNPWRPGETKGDQQKPLETRRGYCYSYVLLIQAHYVHEWSIYVHPVELAMHAFPGTHILSSLTNIPAHSS